jgi:dTMP kinase
MLTPMTFSLIHATDFADRTEQHIIPPFKAGALVLADHYVYTAFARDVARGVDRAWVRNLYRFAVKPTIAFYFRTSVEEAMTRIVGGQDDIYSLMARATLRGADPQVGERRLRIRAEARHGCVSARDC